jgi:hypothetical protein
VFMHSLNVQLFAYVTQCRFAAGHAGEILDPCRVAFGASYVPDGCAGIDTPDTHMMCGSSLTACYRHPHCCQHVRHVGVALSRRQVAVPRPAAARAKVCSGRVTLKMSVCASFRCLLCVRQRNVCCQRAKSMQRRDEASTSKQSCRLECASLTLYHARLLLLL